MIQTCSHCGNREVVVTPGPLQPAELSEQLRSLHGVIFSNSQRNKVLEYIAECDRDVQEIDVTIAALKEKRNSLKNKTFTYRSLVAPIRRLPPELLSRIFVLYCSKQGNRFSLREGKSSPASNSIAALERPTFVLNMVCHGWREVALSVPRIWSNFNLVLDTYSWAPREDTGYVCTKIQNALQTYLELSRNAPLTISFSCLRPSGFDVASQQEIMKQLIQHSDRWQFLTLSLDYPQETEYPQDKCFEGCWSSLVRLPSLKSFELTAGKVSELKLDNLFRVLAHASNLDSFHLVASDISVSSSSTDNLPWNRMTSLCVGRVLRIANLPMLKMCINLTALTLQFIQIRGSDSNDSNVSLITLPCLQSLTIKLQIGTIHVPFVVPSLTSLTLEEMGGQFDYNFQMGGQSDSNFQWPIDHLVSLLSRSKCVLTSLHLECTSLQDEQVLALLEVVPSLLELGLDENHRTCMVTDHLLQTLTLDMSTAPQGASRVLVPNLQRLILHLRNPFRFNFANLVAMLRSRSPGHTSNAGGCPFLFILSIFCRKYSRPNSDLIASQRESLVELERFGMSVDVSKVDRSMDYDDISDGPCSCCNR
ncbi:hypothetical protein VKT23_017374 [Stygiomarasmius scandens]|uniref:F-box domain-containing protein n=1 Tax=Marasmiellus scandens TaxID=2682957 RepID=A0ABR1IV41_9AGAR